MKVHLIKKRSIVEYVRQNSQYRSAFESWLSIMIIADWSKPQDILSTFNDADILGKGTNRVVFNIGGKSVRMICSYYFGKGKVHLFVKWIGIHSQYSSLCRNGKQYTIDQYSSK